MLPHRILIADDDRLILSTLGQGLRDAGYDVVEAINGETAVNICVTSQPDLAILDMRMPGMSGVEAAHLICEQTSTPFMFLSAYGDKEVVQLAVEQGALAYLVKPVDIPQVVPTIEAALARAVEISELRQSAQDLGSALDNNRETSMAVGVIMERYRVNRDQAFKTLRQYARSRRIKINQLASDMLNSVEQFNIPHEFLPRTPV